MKALLAIIFSVACVTGCTVHQEAVSSHSAGFYNPPVRTVGGYIVDSAFRDRYNALVAIYGKKKLENGAPVFLPPLERDQGLAALSDGRWMMSDAAMENMVTLTDLRRRGAAP